MTIRAAREEDAAAMARVMVDTWLAAHRDQMPAEAWAKRAQEWTYADSEQGWARELREIASDADTQECIYIAEEPGGELVGLAMGGPAKTEGLPTTGEVYAVYVRASHQGRGLGRRLVQAVAAHLAQQGRTALHIGCLAANAPGRRFYESLGGQVVDERLADEEGVMLPELVYGWADTGALVGRPNGEAAMIYRIAAEADIDQLAQMRWDFRLEEAPGTTRHDQSAFLDACVSFLRLGLAEQRWAYWIAQQDALIVAHIFIQRIAKVPKPNRLDDAFGYITNVYTRPAFRGRGIGTQLMARVLQWAGEQDLESLIVWPSETSVRFYERAGFQRSADMLEYAVRPYIL